MTIEIRAIVPVDWDSQKIFDGLVNSMDVLAANVKKDFEATVATWEEPAKFEKAVLRVGSDLVIRVSTTNPRWQMLDAGTPARVIVPHAPGGVIAFRPDFAPKTTPRVFSSGAGSRGGEMVFTKSVMHPGIRPREWSDAAREKYQPKMAPQADAGLLRGLWVATKGFRSKVVGFFRGG